mmetsp:Transcript_76153/g.202325  ORF Transcript_76153/g.202325 Transcript_76153/m.202325 type:complete len:250 (-) Transcript_76153:1057-1806(-)
MRQCAGSPKAFSARAITPVDGAKTSTVASYGESSVNQPRLSMETSVPTPCCSSSCPTRGSFNSRRVRHASSASFARSASRRLHSAWPSSSFSAFMRASYAARFSAFLAAFASAESGWSSRRRSAASAFSSTAFSSVDAAGLGGGFIRTVIRSESKILFHSTRSTALLLPPSPWRPQWPFAPPSIRMRGRTTSRSSGSAGSSPSSPSCTAKAALPVSSLSSSGGPLSSSGAMGFGGIRSIAWKPRMGKWA